MNNRKVLVAIVFSIVTALTLTACQDSGAKFDEQYEMLRETSAPPNAICELATEAAGWAFANREREAFRKWSGIKSDNCTTSFEEAAGKVADENGFLIGEYNYPSDYIPDDIQACASNVETNELFCDAKRSGDSFTFELPPGKYNVWAETSDNPGYKAYFSKAVKCGLSVDCTDHTAITVNLEPGEKISGIRPHDWYAEN